MKAFLASIFLTKGNRLMEDNTLKYHMRLRVYRRERNFGPGVSSLMELVKEKESLSAACREMHMAYSKAWKIIRQAEADLGFSLMEGQRGGDSGGRTVLTPEGEELLKRYQAFEAEVQAAADTLFEKHFPYGKFHQG